MIIIIINIIISSRIYLLFKFLIYYLFPIIIIIIINTTITITTPLRIFHTEHKQMAFHWSLKDSKSPQVSKILLSILTSLNNAVAWMVSTCPLISKSSSPIINPSVTIPSTAITIGITITFIFHSFFRSLARS